MAKVVTTAKTWFVDTADLDMRALDVSVLRSGDIGVAFGGANAAGSGVIYTGLVDLAAGTLGALTTTLYPGNPSGGAPVTTVRSIELEQGAGNDMVLTFHMANSVIGLDGNFALLTRVYNGTAPTGTPHAVNPSTPLENTNEVYSTLTRANGSYLTFSTALGGGANLSDGIVMTAFKANGSLAAAPKVIVADHDASTFVQANPETPSATFMASGHIGLLYKDSTGLGDSEVVFQEYTQTGTAVAPAVVLQSGSALAGQIETLKGGAMIATWQSVVAKVGGVVMGQMLDATGHKLGLAFEISAEHIGSESKPDVVALADGGFAVSWFAGTSPLARIFDATGHAKGNDFAVTDDAPVLDAYGAWGLTTKGNSLIGFVSGTEAGHKSVLLGEVFGTGSTLGTTWSGGSTGNTKSGTALDDRLSGLGGNDSLSGLAGNDILAGGIGADTILGGSGRDVIRGGAGRDVLSGGTGGDVFVFDLTNEGRDTIKDFHTGEGDKIGVDNIGFGRDVIPGGGFFLPYLFASVTVSATTDPNVGGLYFNSTSHILSFDADGAGAAYQRFDLAYLPGVTTLSGSDFVIT